MSSIASSEITGSNSPTLLLQGIDSLYVSYFLDTATCKIDWDDLRFQKEQVGRERNRTFGDITLGTERFALKPYGKSPYAFVLSNRHFEVRLGENMHPSCHVQYRSEGLWKTGVGELTKRFETWCRSMALQPLKPEIVSRVDWSFDYHLPVVDFDSDDFVTRAAKKATWEQHNAVQTVQFGRGEIVLRVYDKVAEIEQQSDKAWFFELWGMRQKVWRIEFQVRGERLKEGGIRTLENLQDYQADLLHLLATSHTTLRRPNGDGNRSRWSLHPLWQDLQAQILAMPRTGLGRDIDEGKPIDWMRYQNVKSIYGHLKRLGVLSFAQSDRSVIPDLERTLEELSDELKRHHHPLEWELDVAGKIKAFELGQ
jgi:hypothetical protein